jgi:uncharacterized protein (DUF2062 family)
MPRRFFRKFAVKRHHFGDQWWLAPFEHLLNDPRLWAIRRRTVVPAFALGLFIAYLPYPGHVISVVLLAILIRVNIPVSVLAVLVNNPLTMGPMYYAGYELGRVLLRQPPQPFEFELSFAWLANETATIVPPLILGCTLLGIILALIGYVGLDLLWRASISGYLVRRRQRKKN